MMPIYMIPVLAFRNAIIGDTVIIPALLLGSYSMICMGIAWIIEGRVKSFRSVSVGAFGFVVLFLYVLNL